MTRILVVEPALVPQALQRQSLSAGDLPDRLDEARRLAGNRPVIALFTVQAGTARQDFVQVALPPRMTQQSAAPPPVAELLGSDAAQFDFIPMPDP